MRWVNGFEKRANAFEAGYAAQLDFVLLERLREVELKRCQLEAIEKRTMLNDSQVLEEIVSSGFDDRSVEALQLIPFVLVAWSDRHISDAERTEIFAEANRIGIKHDSSAFPIVVKWLQNNPGKQVELLWQRFVQAYLRSLSPGLRLSFVEHLQSEMKRIAFISHSLHLPLWTKAEDQTITRLSNWVGGCP